MRRSKGWRLSGGRMNILRVEGEGKECDWRMLVYIVFREARNVPKRVRRRPEGVK